MRGRHEIPGEECERPPECEKAHFSQLLEIVDFDAPQKEIDTKNIRYEFLVLKYPRVQNFMDGKGDLKKYKKEFDQSLYSRTRFYR